LNIHELQDLIEERMGGFGIKGIREDLATLEMSEHFPVRAKQMNQKSPKECYLASRPFQTYELRLLLDAVTSARFISYDESIRMIEKLKHLTSRQEATRLRNILLSSEKQRNFLENVGDAIFVLHEAIQDRKCVTFLY
jgi:hypothetical protein